MKKQYETIAVCLCVSALLGQSSFAGMTSAKSENTDVKGNEDTNLSLITEVRDIRGYASTEKVAGISIEPDSECSGSSTCDGNGLLYENLRDFFEKDGNIYGAIGESNTEIQKSAAIGSTQYSLICTEQEENRYRCAVYATDLADNETIRNAAESGEASDQGIAIHMKKLIEVSFLSKEEEPQVRVIIYDTDLYVSWKDDSLGWQTKRYSFLDETVSTDETVHYYDSFGNDCFTCVGEDALYHIRAYDGSWDYTVEKNVTDSAVVGDLAMLIGSEFDDSATKENAEKERYKKYQMYYYRSEADGKLKELKNIPVSSYSQMSVNDTWLYWSVPEDDGVGVYRVQMTTGEQERVCRIVGAAVEDLIAEKDYLILTVNTEDAKLITENDGEFEESNQASFALNLTSNEILLLDTGEESDYTGEDPWEPQAAFPTIAQANSNTASQGTTAAPETSPASSPNVTSDLQAISAAADRIIYSPMLLSRIAYLYGNNLTYNYDWNGIDTQYQFGWPGGVRSYFYLTVDLTTGTGDITYEEADYPGVSYEGTVDFVNLTGTADTIASRYFSYYAPITDDPYIGITWDECGASYFATRADYVIDSATNGLLFSCISGSASSYMSVSAVNYIGNSGRGKLIFALTDATGVQTGYAVCDSYYNYYAVYDRNCAFLAEGIMTP